MSVLDSCKLMRIFTAQDHRNSVLEICRVKTFGQVDFQSGALIFYRHFTHTDTKELILTILLLIIKERNYE